jgi:hypothetical protein
LVSIGQSFASLSRGWSRLDEPVRLPASQKAALVLRHGFTGR